METTTEARKELLCEAIAAAKQYRDKSLAKYPDEIYEAIYYLMGNHLADDNIRAYPDCCFSFLKWLAANPEIAAEFKKSVPDKFLEMLERINMFSSWMGEETYKAVFDVETLERQGGQMRVDSIEFYLEKYKNLNNDKS
jgi:hypothetical protein